MSSTRQVLFCNRGVIISLGFFIKFYRVDRRNIRNQQPILERYFIKKLARLHDGAAVIGGIIIVATRVILPVSN